jgi:hypothetical protein
LPSGSGVALASVIVFRGTLHFEGLVLGMLHC